MIQWRTADTIRPKHLQRHQAPGKVVVRGVVGAVTGDGEQTTWPQCTCGAQSVGSRQLGARHQASPLSCPQHGKRGTNTSLGNQGGSQGSIVLSRVLCHNSSSSTLYTTGVHSAPHKDGGSGTALLHGDRYCSRGRASKHSTLSTHCWGGQCVDSVVWTVVYCIAKVP